MCCHSRSSCLPDTPVLQRYCPLSAHQRMVAVDTWVNIHIPWQQDPLETNARVSVGARAGSAGNRRISLCCLWGMLLAVPHRREGLQEQVQPGGSRQFWVHATCSSGAPARYVVANRVLRLRSAAVYCKPTSRVQRRLHVPRLGRRREPWYWSASPASENKQQNTAGEV